MSPATHSGSLCACVGNGVGRQRLPIGGSKCVLGWNNHRRGYRPGRTIQTGTHREDQPAGNQFHGLSQRHYRSHPTHRTYHRTGQRPRARRSEYRRAQDGSTPLARVPTQRGDAHRRSTLYGCLLQPLGEFRDERQRGCSLLRCCYRCKTNSSVRTQRHLCANADREHTQHSRTGTVVWYGIYPWSMDGSHTSEQRHLVRAERLRSHRRTD